jgi:hypothetical protein
LASNFILFLTFNSLLALSLKANIFPVSRNSGKTNAQWKPLRDKSVSDDSHVLIYYNALFQQQNEPHLFPLLDILREAIGPTVRASFTTSLLRKIFCSIKISQRAVNSSRDRYVPSCLSSVFLRYGCRFFSLDSLLHFQNILCKDLRKQQVTM